jgi:hypothetical protein
VASAADLTALSDLPRVYFNHPLDGTLRYLEADGSNPIIVPSWFGLHYARYGTVRIRIYAGPNNDSSLAVDLDGDVHLGAGRVGIIRDPNRFVGTTLHV